VRRFLLPDPYAIPDLAAGNAGYVLVSTGTGLTWAEQNTTSRYQCNGEFSLWQMGVGAVLAAASGQTDADLWSYNSGANFAQYTVNRQAATTQFQYALRYARNNLQTDTALQSLIHDFESLDSYQFAGRQITLSFWARCGANYSAQALGAVVYSGTGVDQALRAGAYTGQVTVANSNVVLTTSWQRFSVTGSVGTTATQLGLVFSFTPAGTAGANDWYEVTGVQIDEGAYALPWRATPFALCLEACQRRLFKTFAMAQAPVQNLGSAAGCYRGTAVAAGAVTYRGPFFTFPTRQRIAPTVTSYSPLAATAQMHDTSGGLACTATGAVVSEIGLLFTCTQNAGTAIGNSLSVHFLADARI
jgi:hypothetical protein